MSLAWIEGHLWAVLLLLSLKAFFEADFHWPPLHHKGRQLLCELLLAAVCEIALRQKDQTRMILHNQNCVKTTFDGLAFLRRKGASFGELLKSKEQTGAGLGEELHT